MIHQLQKNKLKLNSIASSCSKILFFLLLFFSFLPISKGQSRMGLKGGFNLSHVRTPNDGGSTFENRPLVSGQLGLSYEFNTSYFQVETDILLAGKGYVADSPTSIEYTYVNSYYICLPITLKYKFAQKWNFGIGPELSYLFLGRTKHIDINKKPTITFVSTTDFNSGPRNLFELGVVTGVSYQLRPRVSCNLRYVLGVTPDFEIASIRRYNGSLQLSAIYWMEQYESKEEVE